MDIGKLDRRASFNQPFKQKDLDGNVIQNYVFQFSVWVNVRWLRGGESVMQARMQSRSPAIMTVRKSLDTSRITSEWRVTLDGREFHVKEDPRPSDNRAFLEMLVESMS